jgi:hypothetical protein
MIIDDPCLPSDTSDRLGYATGQMKDFQDLIRFADAKAGAAITLQSGLLVILLANQAAVVDVANRHSGVTQLLFLGSLFGLSVVSLITFLMVLYYAFLTLLPRLEKKEYKPSVAFFLDVFNMKEESFVSSVTNMPLPELLDHALREVYMLSEIVTAKFAAQRRCFQWLKFALIFWALSQLALLFLQHLA